ncbi:MAG TPA: hypothetical protein DCY27_10905 [Desulfobacterales bacterium]|nr:hypothetical protein [Desulfobacterales bacterium]
MGAVLPGPLPQERAAVQLPKKHNQENTMHKALVGGAGLVPRHLTLVPYLTPEEVQKLTSACRGRHRLRDALLIDTLFQTGLRISEALALTPRQMGNLHGGTVLTIQGKGGKPRLVACPELLAARLKSYAYDQGLGLDDRFFPINRKRGWQIIKAAAARAGLNKRVWPHLLRHSDAIERLRQTGNPKALMLHLGHNSPLMTLRYLSTLTAEEAVRIQLGVVF